MKTVIVEQESQEVIDVLKIAEEAALRLNNIQLAAAFNLLRLSESPGARQDRLAA